MSSRCPVDIPDIDFRTFGGTSVTFTGLYLWLWSPEGFIPTGSPEEAAEAAIGSVR